MTKHLHVWSKIYGTCTIGGVKYSRYWACVRKGCKAKRKP